MLMVVCLMIWGTAIYLVATTEYVKPEDDGKDDPWFSQD